MHLAHLALTNVRSLRRLVIDLAPGIYVIAGENATGKTNLLEAVAMLATTRGLRSGPDRRNHLSIASSLPRGCRSRIVSFLRPPQSRPQDILCAVLGTNPSSCAALDLET